MNRDNATEERNLLIKSDDEIQPLTRSNGPLDEKENPTASQPSKWPAFWNLLVALTFVGIFILLSLTNISGVKESMLGLFAFAAVLESVLLYLKWKEVPPKPNNTQRLDAVKETILVLAIVGAILVAILSSPLVGGFHVAGFIVPLVFSIAVGIRALFFLFQAGASVMKIRQEPEHFQKGQLKEAVAQNLYFFLAMGLLTAAVPAVMIYNIPHLNWLGVAATGLLAIFSFYQLVIKPRFDRGTGVAGGDSVSVSEDLTDSSKVWSGGLRFGLGSAFSARENSPENFAGGQALLSSDAHGGGNSESWRMAPSYKQTPPADASDEPLPDKFPHIHFGVSQFLASYDATGAHQSRGEDAEDPVAAAPSQPGLVIGR